MVKSREKDVHSCEDFIIIVTSGFVVGAAMATFHQKSPNDHPTNLTVPAAETIWTLFDIERETCL